MKKSNCLQVLRAIAFLIVLLAHCGLPLTGGALGVSIFFVLSGFLMFLSYHEREITFSFSSALRHAIKKVFKLYPLYVVTLIYVMYGWNFDLNLIKANIYQLIFDILLVQSWIPNMKYYFAINPVAWFLSAYFFIYLVSPYCIRRVQRVRSNWEIGFIILVIFTLQCLVGMTASFFHVSPKISETFIHWVTYISPFYRVGDFILGLCLAYLYINNKVFIEKWLTNITELIFIMLLGCFVIFYQKNLYYGSVIWFKFTTLWLPISCLAILFFITQKTFLVKKIILQPLIHLGNISGYCFLTHIFIINYSNMLYTNGGGKYLSCNNFSHSNYRLLYHG